MEKEKATKERLAPLLTESNVFGVAKKNMDRNFERLSVVLKKRYGL